MVTSELEREWPSVDPAYAFVVPSYQMLLSRFEAADTRLTTLLTLASSLTLGAPILAKAVRPDISFTSPAFCAAVTFFVLCVTCGVVGRVKGRVTLPDPMVFHQTSLHEPTWTFKKNALYFAGLAFKANTEAINRKGNMSVVVTVVMLLEIVALIVWIGIG